jgi:hypothetical protein
MVLANIIKAFGTSLKQGFHVSISQVINHRSKKLELKPPA